MKVDRLIGIITVLQRKGKATIPYLAEKFEVSRRTVSRDIEDLCRAGIPIATTQGSGGGVEIMKGFCLDTTVFTREELQSMLAGINALDSVNAGTKGKVLESKLYSDENTVSLSENLIIDLASFHKDSLSEKINLLRQAADEGHIVKFRYFYNKGEEDKEVEPYLIIFKWSSWYLFGYCPQRKDFRMYKLNRLWELAVTEKRFEKRKVPKEKTDFGQFPGDKFAVKALYEPSEKYRLIEEYGPYSFQSEEDGRLCCELGFTDCKSALVWFMSFGDKVEILSPDSFKEEYISVLKNTLKKY